jgi:hypothetical protein
MSATPPPSCQKTATKGREMDALVAEKVMGWALYPRRTSGLAPGSRRAQGLPPYSTDVAAAWDMLTERFGSVFIEVHNGWTDDGNGNRRGGWNVTITDNHGTFTGWGETMPAAACAAALAARGVTP